MAYGLTRLDTRKAAFEFASCNDISMPIQWTENRMAGRPNHDFYKVQMKNSLKLK